MMHGFRSGARRAVLIGVIASASMGSGGWARADEGVLPRADNRARAQQLFDSALSDAEAGNLASACPKFLASQEADPKTSTLLNLASCYEKNGQTASAWGAFREAEGLARKVGRSDWETTARSHAELLEPKLVRLTIQVSDTNRVPGLTITRDGARIAAAEWGVAIPVDPGEHVIAASAAGRAPWESRTSVRDASQTVSVPLLAAAPDAEVPPAVAAPDRTPPLVPEASPTSSWWTPLRTTGVVVAGVGAAGLVTGAILALVAKGRYDDARDRCSDGSAGCPADAVRDSDSAYGLAGGATAIVVIGAVAAAGGAAIILLAPPPAKGASTSAARASVRVGLGSVGVQGRW